MYKGVCQHSQVFNQKRKHKQTNTCKKVFSYMYNHMLQDDSSRVSYDQTSQGTFLLRTFR